MPYVPINKRKPATGAVLSTAFDFGEHIRICLPLNDADSGGAALSDIGVDGWRADGSGGSQGALHNFRAAAPGIYRNNGGAAQLSIADGNPWLDDADRGPVLDFTTLPYWVIAGKNADASPFRVRRGAIPFSFRIDPAGAGVVRRLICTSIYGGGLGGLRVSIRTTGELRVEAIGTGSTSIDASTAGPLATGVWHNGLILIQQTTWKVFLNDPVTPLIEAESATGEEGWLWPAGAELWYGGGFSGGGTFAVPTTFSKCRIDSLSVLNQDPEFWRYRELLIDPYYHFRRRPPSSFSQKITVNSGEFNRHGSSVSISYEAPIQFGGADPGDRPQIGLLYGLRGDSDWQEKWGDALPDGAPHGSKATVTLSTADLPGMTAGVRPDIYALWRLSPDDPGEPWPNGLLTPKTLDPPGVRPRLAAIGDEHGGHPRSIGTTPTLRDVTGEAIFDWFTAGVDDEGRAAGLANVKTAYEIFCAHEPRNYAAIVNGNDNWLLGFVPASTPDPEADDHPVMWGVASVANDHRADLVKCGLEARVRSHHDCFYGGGQYARQPGGQANKSGAFTKQAVGTEAMFVWIPQADTYRHLLGGLASAMELGGDFDPSGTGDFEPLYGEDTDSAGNLITTEYRDRFITRADGLPIWRNAAAVWVFGDLVLIGLDTWAPADVGGKNLGNWIAGTGGTQHPLTTNVDPKPWKLGRTNGGTQRQFLRAHLAMARDMERVVGLIMHTWPDANDAEATGGE